MQELLLQTPPTHGLSKSEESSAAHITRVTTWRGGVQFNFSRPAFLLQYTQTYSKVVLDLDDLALDDDDDDDDDTTHG